MSLYQMKTGLKYGLRKTFREFRGSTVIEGQSGNKGFHTSSGKEDRQDSEERVGYGGGKSVDDGPVLTEGGKRVYTYIISSNFVRFPPY